jgi:hypothetical protein
MGAAGGSVTATVAVAEGRGAWVAVGVLVGTAAGAVGEALDPSSSGPGVGVPPQAESKLTMTGMRTSWCNRAAMEFSFQENEPERLVPETPARNIPETYLIIKQKTSEGTRQPVPAACLRPKIRVYKTA